MKRFVKPLTPEECLFQKIRMTVRTFLDGTLPDLRNYQSGSPVKLSCHIMARAAGSVFDLTVVDGYFYPVFNHSWLLLESRNIIDVYPEGLGILNGPLYIPNIGSVGRSLYLERTTSEISRKVEPVYNFEEPAFKRAVETVTCHLKEIASRIYI